MSLGHGASVVRNGLVFQYDMENTAKSWKGKPTTNLVPNPVFSPSSYSPWNYQTTANGNAAIDNSVTYDGYPSLRLTRTSTGGECNVWLNLGSSQGLQANTQYTFSAWVLANKSNEAALFSYYGTTSNSYQYHSGSGRWERVEHTFTTRSTEPYIQIRMWHDTTTLNSPIWFAKLQVEGGSFASPFTLSSRSNTQALIDISKGDNTITASTVSYNADGTFQFDGTDDWATASSLYLGSDPVLSVEMWVKRTSSFSSGGYWGFGGGSSGNGINAYANPSRANKIGWDLWGLTTFDTGQDYPLNEWIHVVWVKTASSFTTSTLKVYINGVDTPLSHTARNNGSTVNLVDGFTFGRISDNITSYYAPGVISQCLVYNRALSSQEIQQNFSATRDRYGV